MKRKFLTLGVLISLVFACCFTSCGGGATAWDVDYGYDNTSSFVMEEGDVNYLLDSVHFVIYWDFPPSEDEYYNAIHFSSDNDYVASVDKYGKITANHEGSTVISLRVDGCFDVLQWQVTVYGSSSLVTSISPKEPSVSMNLYDSKYVYLAVSPYYAANTAVTVSSSDENVATATIYGSEVYISAIGEGSAEITITSVSNPSVTAKIDVTVSIQPTYDVTSVSLNRSTLSLDINETYTLIPTVSAYYTSTNRAVTWTSSNTSVATVSSSGVVTGISAGSAIITATSKDNPSKYAECLVDVTNVISVSLESISIEASAMSVYNGETITLTAIPNPSDASNVDIIWSYSGTASVTLIPNADDSTNCSVTGRSTGSVKVTAKSSADDSIKDEIELTFTNRPSVSSDNFFWGTWIRMDKGTTVEIDETALKEVESNVSTEFDVGCDEETLKLIGGKVFTKQSNAVIQTQDGDATVLYFRKGGTNLSYSLKIVGFDDSIPTRAAGNSGPIGKNNVKVKGLSNRFTSHISNAVSDSEGKVELKAPIQGDVQTVVVELEGRNDITIENLKIENDGDDMGTVPIVDEGDYSLKITGVINNSDKTEGYLYASHTYPMTLTITNISDYESEPSIVTISTSSSQISLTNARLVKSDGTERSFPISEGYTIPTLKPWTTSTVKIDVVVGAESTFTNPSEDVVIDINVKNPITERTWIDYVPLRVFKKTVNFAFNSKSAYENNDATLNGFLIFPDGNNKFFSAPVNTEKVVEVPLFNSSEDYILVFSGATTTGDLDDTTELYYTVVVDSNVSNPVNVSSSELKAAAMSFGENSIDPETGRRVRNNREEDAYEIYNDFQAYLSESDIDYYKIKINSNRANTNGTTIIQPEDLDVEYTFDDDNLILTATEGYSEYQWKLEGSVLVGTENTISIPKSNLSDGINQIYVFVSSEGLFKQINIAYSVAEE